MKKVFKVTDITDDSIYYIVGILPPFGVVKYISNTDEPVEDPVLAKKYKTEIEAKIAAGLNLVIEMVD